MSSFDFLNSPGLFIEIGPRSWQVLDGESFIELPLSLLENGRLSDAGREGLVAGLREFINKKGWRPRLRAFAAMGARGVSMRRMWVPAAAKDELQRVLRLQIESEFPLPPEEMAWGWQLLGQKSGRQEVLVVAVKKELVEVNAGILAECGITPFFTLAALARHALCPPPAATCAVLHPGAMESEMLFFQDGAPSSIRLIPWGYNSGTPLPDVARGPLYLTGNEAAQAAQGLPVLELGDTGGHPPAIAGLKKLTARDAAHSPLFIHVGENKIQTTAAGSWKWAAAAVIMVLALVCLPYAEAVLLKPHLAKKLAAIQVDRIRLPAIDHELDFLQYLKRTEPPYLDTIYLMSKVAPQGTSFDSMTLNRRGEFSVRGKLQNAGQVTELRSNMIGSAWFSSVVVEEQTPTPDRQVTIRMTAQVKSIDSRKPIVDDPPAKSEHNPDAVTPAAGKKK